MLDRLQHFHPHHRDGDLTFDAATHTYFWNGSKVKISATSLTLLSQGDVLGGSQEEDVDFDEQVALEERFAQETHTVPETTWEVLQRRRLLPSVNTEANFLLEYQANKQRHCDRMGGTSDSPLRTLQRQYFYPPCADGFTLRARSQLQQYRDQVGPLELTFKRFPLLYFILPVPFDFSESCATWRLRLEPACFFVSLLQEGRPIQLEAALIAWFWPGTQRKTSLLEVISTATSSATLQQR